MNQLKWPVIALLSCTSFNIINLLVFKEYANFSWIYRQFGLIGSVICQFLALMAIGGILAAVIRRKDKYTINKIAKYGLLSFLILLALTPLIMFALTHLFFDI